MSDELQTPPPVDLLNYATTSAILPPRQGTVPAWCLWILAFLLTLEATTAVRIEWLNQQAGGILPRHELRDDGTMTKWRGAIGTTEASWIRYFAAKDEHGQPSPLSDSEKARMQREIVQARADNRLRDVVSTWGLLQYILAPTTFILAAYFWNRAKGNRSRRALAVAGLLISIAAGCLAFARAYFTSLGW